MSFWLKIELGCFFDSVVRSCCWSFSDVILIIRLYCFQASFWYASDWISLRNDHSRCSPGTRGLRRVSWFYGREYSLYEFWVFLWVGLACWVIFCQFWYENRVDSCWCREERNVAEIWSSPDSGEKVRPS